MTHPTIFWFIEHILFGIPSPKAGAIGLHFALNITTRQTWHTIKSSEIQYFNHFSTINFHSLSIIIVWIKLHYFSFSSQNLHSTTNGVNKTTAKTMTKWTELLLTMMKIKLKINFHTKIRFSRPIHICFTFYFLLFLFFHMKISKKNLFKNPRKIRKIVNGKKNKDYAGKIKEKFRLILHTLRSKAAICVYCTAIIITLINIITAT